MIQRVFVRAFFVFALAFSISTATASAQSLLIDDDSSDCPAATFTRIQPAIDAADAGDELVVCPGVYAEGPGTPGSNALTITKSLSIRGAGADLVTIRPRANSSAGGQIAANHPELRDPVGNIITVFGAPSFPLTVDISGVTVSGGGHETKFPGTDIWDGEFEGGVYSEAGILFLDAGGSVAASRITNIVTSERPEAQDWAGGYRSNDFGYGIAQVSAASSAPPNATDRELTITGTRLDRFNRTGVLIDGATTDDPPLTATGIKNDATITGSQVIGRNLNSPPNDGTGGGDLLTTGTVFGQDGIRVTAGSSLDFQSGIVSQNLMAGAGSDTVDELPNAAGVRLIGAGASSVTESNVLNNSYGVVNVELDGATPNTADPVDASDVFWGYPGTIGSTNTGPAVSPVTLPDRPSNPVNGTTDVTFGSDAVHFLPYRAGGMADTDTGYWPIQDAPILVEDAAPEVTLNADPVEISPGGKIKLTATATDDFGVKQLVFYDGTDEIATVTPPDDAVEWTAPEVCGPRELSVLAEDSSGQSASAAAAVTVIDCPNPPTAAPTIELVAPPREIKQKGTSVNARVDAEAGVASVKFTLGDRQVCDLTAAPYRCLILPLGEEIGAQSLRAVVTDTEGRTAEAGVATLVVKFRPKGLVVKGKRAGKKKAMIRIRGSLKRPDRMSVAQACAASRVTVTARQGRLQLINRQVKLAANCGYKLGFKAKRTKKNRRKVVHIKVRFPGNASLTPISAKTKVR